MPALSLAIIALVQGTGIGTSVPNADGSYGDTSRDFMGQGMANVAAGFFDGATMGGSVNATALNVSAGWRSRWSSVFAGVVVIVVVLAAAPLVSKVPLAVTACILMVATISTIRIRAIKEIWAADRLSAGVMAITFALVLVVPLQYAVLAGATISVLNGRVRKVAGHPELSDAAVRVLDIYGNLFFAAAPKVKACLPPAATARRAVVVLRLRGRDVLHSALLTLLGDYSAGLTKGGGRLYLAGGGHETEEQLRRTHLIDTLGADAIVPATDEFHGACEVAQRRGRQWLASGAALSREAHDAAAAQPAKPLTAGAAQSPDAKAVAAPRTDR